MPKALLTTQLQLPSLQPLLLPVLDLWPLLSSFCREIWDSQQQPLLLRDSLAHQVCKDRMETTEAMGMLEIRGVLELKEFKALPDIQDVLVQLLRFQVPWATRELPEPQDEPGLLELRALLESLGLPEPQD